jgi:hypothetical protein
MLSPGREGSNLRRGGRVWFLDHIHLRFHLRRTLEHVPCRCIAACPTISFFIRYTLRLYIEYTKHTLLFLRMTRLPSSSRARLHDRTQLTIRLHRRPRCSSLLSLDWLCRIASLVPRSAGQVAKARIIDRTICRGWCNTVRCYYLSDREGQNKIDQGSTHAVYSRLFDGPGAVFHLRQRFVSSSEK